MSLYDVNGDNIEHKDELSTVLCTCCRVNTVPQDLLDYELCEECMELTEDYDEDGQPKPLQFS